MDGKSIWGSQNQLLKFTVYLHTWHAMGGNTAAERIIPSECQMAFM
jgi:hypothetical protein